MNKSIKVVGLEKSYRQLQVLKGVDFEVEQGSVLPCLAPMAQARPPLSKSSPLC